VKFHDGSHGRNSSVVCCRCCSAASPVVSTLNSRVCPHCRHGRDPQNIRLTSSAIRFRTLTSVLPRKPTRGATIGLELRLDGPLNSECFRESRPVPNQSLSPTPRGAATAGSPRCSVFAAELHSENLRCSGRSGRLLWTEFFTFGNFSGRICSKALRGC
jgi:hypothetical protein